MNILIAPNAFKECLTADEAARAMAKGVRRADPKAKIRLLPLADGGDGTLDVLARALGARRRRAVVEGPLGRPVLARWALSPGGVALIEMAEASGLRLVPPSQRNPTKTSTRGTGQLIRAALDAGAKEILIGLGGSATNDAGLGMAEALGAAFCDREGRRLPGVGASLAQLRRWDISTLDPRLRKIGLTAICDVKNPLHGPRGAAYVFAPQKGAAPAQVRALDKGLRNFARLARRAEKDIARVPGAGAAGGLGAGLLFFCGGRLRSGIETVFSKTGVERHVRWADVVLTGEGRVDASSVEGKTPGALARLARKRRKKLVVFCGARGPGHQKILRAGAAAVIEVSADLKPGQRARETAGRLAAAAAQLFTP